MYQERFLEPHKLGLERFTHSNSGRFFTNEQLEIVITEEGERIEYVYDVYEIDDCRNPNKVKNQVVETEHPFGDEYKILRKTLYKLLEEFDLYNNPNYNEFKEYNEFVETINKK